MYISRIFATFWCVIQFSAVETLSVNGRPTGRNAKAHLQPTKPPVLYDHLLENFIVVPEYKLIFCYMEKVANMNFNILFMKMRSPFDISQKAVLDDPNGDVWMQNTPTRHNFSKGMLEQAFMNRSWHKAVFYREPLERFVSAYRSKCEGRNPDGLYWCQKQFGSNSTEFAEAVHSLARLPLDKNFDHNPPYDNHFQRQISFCGGLKNSLQYYDTIEMLDSRNSHEKVSKMLKNVGASPSKIINFNRLFPPKIALPIQQKTLQSQSDSIQKHNTYTKKNLMHYFSGKDAKLAEMLIDHYKEDYNVFKIKVPSWVQRAIKRLDHKKANNTSRGFTLYKADSNGNPLLETGESNWPLDG